MIMRAKIILIIIKKGFLKLYEKKESFFFFYLYSFNKEFMKLQRYSPESFNPDDECRG